MTEPKPLVAPERVADETVKNTIMFLGVLWASGEHPAYPIDYEIVRGQGLDIEAIVRDHEGSILIRERISLRPTINAWITDLLDRAEKARGK